jgi:hypothetical protein
MARRLGTAISSWLDEHVAKLVLSLIMALLAGAYSISVTVIRLDNDFERFREFMAVGGCCQQRDCQRIAEEILRIRSIDDKSKERITALEQRVARCQEEVNRLRGKHDN